MTHKMNPNNILSKKVCFAVQEKRWSSRLTAAFFVGVILKKRNNYATIYKDYIRYISIYSRS